MLSFDVTYTYQFGLFFSEEAELAPELVDKLASVLNAPVAGTRGHGLRFVRPESERALVVRGRAATPTNTLTWKSGVWRMMFGSDRLDVHFDAKGYADVREEEPLPLSEIRRRVVPNLSRVPDVLKHKPNRLALIVTGKAREELTRATALIARMFLRPELAAESEELRDTVVRINRAARWSLPSHETDVNRNETASAVWALRNGVEETTLSWQLDVNTSPLETTSAEFGSDDIDSFFKYADEWIESRLKLIGEAR